MFLFLFTDSPYNLTVVIDPFDAAAGWNNEILFLRPVSGEEALNQADISMHGSHCLAQALYMGTDFCGNLRHVGFCGLQ